MKKIKLLVSSILTAIISGLFAVGVNAQGMSPVTNDKFNPLILIIAGVALIGIVVIIILSVKKGKNPSPENDDNKQDTEKDDTDDSEGL